MNHSNTNQGNGKGKIRYGVIGLGHIAQVAVLPAFANAENSELTALVSDDPTKLNELGQRYDVSTRTNYDGYEALLESDAIDAVYLALPNHLHCDYAVRAARAGKHVLCEKPMAVTEEECERMLAAAEDSDVRLMVAYRLHFEAANLDAVQVVQGGELGDPRVFESVFTQNVVPGDVRLMSVRKGGGSVYDMGVYCINAARYLFRDEPYEVAAFSSGFRGGGRFADCDEMTTAVLRFPEGRLASFTTSFGADAVSRYRVVGTKGKLTMDPAYGYATNLSYEVEVGDRMRRRQFEKRDQFAPELIHFSDCVLRGERPEPDGNEGMADVRIVRAIYESAHSGRSLKIAPVPQPKRPSVVQAISRPGFDKPVEVHAAGPKG